MISSAEAFKLWFDFPYHSTVLDILSVNDLTKFVESFKIYTNDKKSDIVVEITNACISRDNKQYEEYTINTINENKLLETFLQEYKTNIFEHNVLMYKLGNLYRIMQVELASKPISITEDYYKRIAKMNPLMLLSNQDRVSSTYDKIKDINDDNSRSLKAYIKLVAELPSGYGNNFEKIMIELSKALG